jgi:hypothetical protein
MKKGLRIGRLTVSTNRCWGFCYLAECGIAALQVGCFVFEWSY